MKLDAHNKTPGLWVILFAGFIVFDVWLLNFLLGINPELFGGRGTFGDVFGASNALFSGFALTGIIYAVLLQRAEIRLAKDELKRTKQIFEKQSESLSLQNAETRKQIFENTFFQLIGVFTNITENLDLVSGQRTTRGKDVVTIFESRLQAQERGLRRAGSPHGYREAYDALYSNEQNDLGHYFRILYTVIVFVHTSEVSNKKFYTNILRAQLSNSELHLLLYNGLSKHGVEKLKPLLEQYEFFDNLPIRKVHYREALIDYHPSAFGENEEIQTYIASKTSID